VVFKARSGAERGIDGQLGRKRLDVRGLVACANSPVRFVPPHGNNNGDLEMLMTEYSTNDLSRRSGDIIAEALRRPVTITQRNKPRLVLLSIEDYRRLMARADIRKAGRLDAMPDDLFEDLKQAVTVYEQGDDT
jgi:prevent-host-death family protein